MVSKNKTRENVLPAAGFWEMIVFHSEIMLFHVWHNIFMEMRRIILRLESRNNVLECVNAYSDENDLFLSFFW